MALYSVHCTGDGCGWFCSVYTVLMMVVYGAMVMVVDGAVQWRCSVVMVVDGGVQCTLHW